MENNTINYKMFDKLRDELISAFLWYRNTYLNKFEKITYNYIKKSKKYNFEDKYIMNYMFNIYKLLFKNKNNIITKNGFINCLSLQNEIQTRIYNRLNLKYQLISSIKYDKLIYMLNKRHFKVI